MNSPEITTTTPSVAVVTGASRGLGLALATSLAERGWHLVVDARQPGPLTAVAEQLTAAGAASVTALAGDVADTTHRGDLAGAVRALGSLSLLVNNASLLGPSPQPPLATYPVDVWRRVFDVNVLAPLALTQAMLPSLRTAGGAVVNISSDAAVEAYEGWGGYGSSKAALDHWTAILAVEEAAVSVYAFDPGDMRTQMQQDAFPGEDISDRPRPESVVPAFWRLLSTRPSSGRYQAASFRAPGAVA